VHDTRSPGPKKVGIMSNETKPHFLSCKINSEKTEVKNNMLLNNKKIDVACDRTLAEHYTFAKPSRSKNCIVL
jgi:hypothetical protein